MVAAPTDSLAHLVSRKAARGLVDRVSAWAGGGWDGPEEASSASMKEFFGYTSFVAVLVLLVVGVVADVRHEGNVKRGVRAFPGTAGASFATWALVAGIAAALLLGWSRT